jgi:thiol:disulfide interchange protein DsbD
MRANLRGQTAGVKNRFKFKLFAGSAIYTVVRIVYAFIAIAGLFAGAAANAAATRVELVLDNQVAKPGETVSAGVLFHLQPGWHTYWQNPGGPGYAASIKWQLPAGVTNGPMQWPVPEKFQDSLGTWYIYEKELMLIVPLKVDAQAASGPLKLAADVDWLECEVQCVPRNARVQAQLEIGAEDKPSSAAAVIKTWKNRLPHPKGDLPVTATLSGSAGGSNSVISISWNSGQPISQADFYPYANDAVEFQSNIMLEARGPGLASLRMPIVQTGTNQPAGISGLILQQSATGSDAFEISAPLVFKRSTLQSTANPETPNFWRMLFYAFLGGLILNAMPCVLPVIALKILSFVSESKDDMGRVRKLGVVYAAGVLASFLAMAVLVIALQAAGHKAGWGIQLSSPHFVIALAILITLVSLNLFGVFEVSPGGKVLDSAGELASRRGTAGAFFNGVLATVLGAPCTAGFLAPALGFAFAQPARVIVVFFLTIGFGMALPYLVLSLHPVWLRALPKPGRWMVRFKTVMGFPMVATAIWLLSLLPTHYGHRAWWVGVFLIVVSIAAWVYGEFAQRGRSNRMAIALISLAIVALGYFEVLEKMVHWRTPLVQSENQGAIAEAPAGLAWKSWSHEAVAKARGEGRPVIVDFTAEWCATCNGQVKPAFESEKVIAALKQLNAQPLVADYTRTPPNITDELRRFGRAGVPLVLVYSRDPNAQPMVLTEPLPLTDYGPVILDALAKLSE